MSNINEMKLYAKKRKLEKYGYNITQLLNNKELTSKEAKKLKKDLENYNVIIWKGYTFIKLGENIGIYDYYTRRFAELKIIQELIEGEKPLFYLAEIPYIVKQFPNMRIYYKEEDRKALDEYIKHIMGKNEFEYSETNMNRINSFLGKIFENTENIDLNIILSIIKYNKSKYENQSQYELRNSIHESIIDYLKTIKMNKTNKNLKILYNCKNPTKQKTYLHEEQALKARKYADVEVGLMRKLFWKIQDSLEEEFQNKDAISVYRDEFKLEKREDFKKQIKVEQNEEVNPYTTDIKEFRKRLTNIDKEK